MNDGRRSRADLIKKVRQVVQNLKITTDPASGASLDSNSIASKLSSIVNSPSYSPPPKPSNFFFNNESCIKSCSPLVVQPVVNRFLGIDDEVDVSKEEITSRDSAKNNKQEPSKIIHDKDLNHLMTRLVDTIKNRDFRRASGRYSPDRLRIATQKLQNTCKFTGNEFLPEEIISNNQNDLNKTVIISPCEYFPTTDTETELEDRLLQMEKTPKKTVKFDEKTNFLYAIKSDDTDEMLSLLDKYPEFLYINERGKTLLHMSAAKGNLAYCKLFIEKGLNVNAQDIRGQTPLHFACINNNVELIKYLLQSGASPFIFSEFWEAYPVMLVSREEPSGDEIVAIFIKYADALGSENDQVAYVVNEYINEGVQKFTVRKMSPIKITHKSGYSEKSKWEFFDENGRTGQIPWKLLTLYPTKYV